MPKQSLCAPHRYEGTAVEQDPNIYDFQHKKFIRGDIYKSYGYITIYKDTCLITKASRGNWYKQRRVIPDHRVRGARYAISENYKMDPSVIHSDILT